jgi:hypothetical protein
MKNKMSWFSFFDWFRFLVDMPSSADLESPTEPGDILIVDATMVTPYRPRAQSCPDAPKKTDPYWKCAQVLFDQEYDRTELEYIL